jgi:hypothetical protein
MFSAGNPASLTTTFAAMNTREVLSYLRKSADTQTEKWTELKVLFLGNPGVGKTTLVRSIAEKNLEVVIPLHFLAFICALTLSLSASASHCLSRDVLVDGQIL